ncbi:MAG: DMT family transporter [Alphaproteobacteria bacterium]
MAGRGLILSEHGLGLLLITCGVLLWSTEGLLVRLTAIDGWTLALGANLAMAFFVGLWTVSRYGRNTVRAYRDIGRPGLLAALTLGVGNVFFYHAFQATSVANVFVLVSSQPFFAAVLAYVLLREPVRPRLVVLMAVAMAGIAYMFRDSLVLGSWRGDLMALAAGILYSANIICLRSAPTRDGRLRDLMPSHVLGGLLGAALVAPLASPSTIGGGDLLILLAIGGGSLGAGMWFYTRSFRYLPAAEGALVIQSQVLIGPLLVWAALGEQPPAATITGGLVVFAALTANAALGLNDGRRGRLAARNAGGPLT